MIARVDRLTYRYPGASHDALADVSLDLRAGELVLLAGPSGGGKSTLLRALAGLVPHFHGGCFAGRVVVDGLDTRRTPPARIARRAGLAFQDPEAQVVHGTALRDVAFGLESHRMPAGELETRSREALERVDAGHLAERRLETLSGGELQRVVLAGVLAPRPPLLLLDEPTAQLDDAAAATLVRLLRRLADEGLALVVAEHRLDRLAPVADVVLGVHGGRLSDEAERVAAPERAVGDARREGDPVLAAERLDVAAGPRVVVRGVDLALPRGSVLALLGANGTGKTSLLRALAGLAEPAEGRVLLEGRDVTRLPPERRYPTLAFVPQDPGRHLLCERVDDELAFGLRTLGAVPERVEAAVAATLAALDLTPLRERHPRDLSVGERERTALGAALAADPAVLLLDEPTRGMDPSRRLALAAVLRARAEAGRSAIVATHDRAFAAAACDAVVELRDGRARPRTVEAVPA